MKKKTTTLYTGRGDKGTTKVLDSKPGERISKNSERAEALGSLDELNAWLGLVRVHASQGQNAGVKVGRKTQHIADILRQVQKDLFIVQAEAAGGKKRIRRAKVAWQEGIIEAIATEIREITSFTIAGGAELSAELDVARTIARRTERRVVAVHESGERKLGEQTRAYLNRLSSLLFALARIVNHRSGFKEEAPDYK